MNLKIEQKVVNDIFWREEMEGENYVTLLYPKMKETQTSTPVVNDHFCFYRITNYK